MTGALVSNNKKSFSAAVEKKRNVCSIALPTFLSTTSETSVVVVIEQGRLVALHLALVHCTQGREDKH